MAQAQAEKTPQKVNEMRGGIITRSVRCTSNGGETSSVVNFANYGMAAVISATAYSQTAAAQIVAANTVLTAKATVTVTHAADNTIMVTAVGVARDVNALA